MSVSLDSCEGISNYVYECIEQKVSTNLWDSYPRLQPPLPSPTSLAEGLKVLVKMKEAAMTLRQPLSERIVKRMEELKMIDNSKVKRLLLKKLVDLYLTVSQIPDVFDSQDERGDWESRLIRVFERLEERMLHLMEKTKPQEDIVKVDPPLKTLKVVSDIQEKIQFVIDETRDDVALLWRKAKSMKEIISKALAAAESARLPTRYFEIIRESLEQIEYCLCEEASVPSMYRKEILDLIELLEKVHPLDLELILHIKILKLKSIKCVEETDAKHSHQMDKLDTTIRNINYLDNIEHSSPHAYWLRNQFNPLKPYPQPDDDLKLLTFLGDEKHNVEKEALLKEYEDKHSAFERRDLAVERAKRNACLKRKIEQIKRKLIEENRKKVLAAQRNSRAMPQCQHCHGTQMTSRECCEKRCCGGASNQGTVYRSPAASLGCSTLTRGMKVTDPIFICHAPVVKNEPMPFEELKAESKIQERRNTDKLDKTSTPIHYMELESAIEKLFRNMSRRKVKQMAQEKALEEKKNRLRSDSGVYNKERWRKWMLKMQEKTANKTNQN